MNIDANIARFEKELEAVQRPGMDKLLNFIRKSDFYKAPASTKYHLSCEGGLLQHSLNVLDALRRELPVNEDGDRLYFVAGKAIDKVPDDSVTIIALLHDICKTYFYKVSFRNAKNDATGKWEKVPYYTVEDRMPLGHGAKSAMIVKQYIELTSPEMYAIWWHMGFTDTSDTATLDQAIQQYPIIWAMHNADMIASSFMEGNTDNRPMFADAEPEAASDYAAPSATPDSSGEFQDAPALEGGA